MSNLNDTRKKINAIDKEMAKLFVERMNASKEVAEYKMEHGLPIYDRIREEEVIKKNTELIEEDDLKKYYVMFLQDLMDTSKSYQQEIMQGLRVGYSGAQGAFGYIAAKKMFADAKYISYPSFNEAYVGCEKGECDIVVLPVENSYAGDVGTVMDLMFSGSLYINQMIDLDVVHNLVACKGATKETIKKVYSHPQALAQCAEYLKTTDYEQIEYANTAMAAEMISEKKDLTLAAIASSETSELFGLDIIDSHINASRNNTTRFAAFSRVQNLTSPTAKMGEHFILVFTVKNEAGALANALNIIGSHGFNMRTLRSRPMKELMWNYYFYVELDGNINTVDGSDMMMQLSSMCDRLKLVGAYTSRVYK
jgi:chorismate mutase/prephenate dehydratase